MTQTTPFRESLPSLVSIRVVTEDVARLAAFYALVTDSPVQWSTPDFAELRTPAGTLAIGSTRTVALFAAGSVHPADNHTAIIEFLVGDVDAEYERLREAVGRAGGTFLNEPTTMPWGNRSLLFRDPDGNLVNCFAPVTPEATARLGR